MIHRMVRAVLLGLLATAVVSACGSKDATPASQPGAVAGKVLEVSGALTVAGHTLAVGDPVKTDDAVTTGADGNVVIELAHNQARWELGPNHKVKPTESLAWTAAAKTGSAAQVNQDTSAAGRPAERSAADTGATSRAPVMPAAAADNAPAPGAPEKALAPPPPPPKPVAAPHTASPAPQVQPQGLIGGAEGGDGKSSSRTSASPSQRSMTSLQMLASCVAAGSSVHIKAHVANHTATVAFVGDVDATVKQCITTGAKKLTLALDAGDLDLVITH